MHLAKKGLRALGIAESYRGRTHSTLTGVVMRKDLRIDGFSFGTVTVGGMDSTECIVRMVRDLCRQDINVIMLSGCVIAWFNVIQPERIVEETGLAVICVTYEDSDGLIEDIRNHFPGDEARLRAYKSLGERSPVMLNTGEKNYIRCWELEFSQGARFCNDFTIEGKIPEPLRVARLCARSAHNFFTSSDFIET